ncbi:MAG: 2-hydroxyacyl-CoA dehydratase family protein [Candidatus Abyssubacteria bacterium]
MSERPEFIRRMLERSDSRDIDPTYLSGTISRGMHYARLLYRAFAGKSPVAWINVFTPPELVFGLGYLPFWLDGAGGTSGWIEMNDVFERADTLLPSRDMCTFLRAAVGAAAMDLFPQPKVVVCTSHLCEGAPKMARMAARREGVEFHLLDVPSELSEESVAYVAGQVEAVARRLSEISGSKLDIDRLRDAIELSNRARACLTEVYELRAHVPAPVTGSQFVGFSLVYPWGAKAGVSIAESLRDDVAGRVAGNVAAIAGGERHRLMWIHLRPVFETDIMARLEQEMRAVIVVDLMGEAWWPELDPRDPFRAFAMKILSNPELQPMEWRTARLKRLARKYRVDGAVHFLQWGCRWNYGQTALYREAIAELGLPFLALDGDAVDKRATPHGQILTRLEAFQELLEATRSGKGPAE